MDTIVSKLFRAYRLYNDKIGDENKLSNIVSKLFRAYRLYNLVIALLVGIDIFVVSKLFRAYRLYNS